MKSEAAAAMLDYHPRDWRETLAESVQYLVDNGHRMPLPFGVPELPLRPLPGRERRAKL